MIRHLVQLGLVAIVGLILFYISRFWGFVLWESQGLFGIQALHPRGGLLQRWLAGTPLAPFELLIWAALCFLALTGLDKAFARLNRQGDTDPGP